ncbi:hypothetical protein Dsin_033201 [Dipteronia sinensis]|uniref:Uncharacterized protein n=1 Tax=Dipteronia sinensis TaxID=43782 RepID=A0AAD9Z647_9ROSI|nr:hypothetical protein Dsin_033201 [Dipteronia sinensis]
MVKFWNASLGLCECEKNEWKAGLGKGNIWSSVNMSPFEDKNVYVKCIAKGCVPVSVEVNEYVQRWRLFFLASGFVLFVLAPILSKWVHFYYTSSVLMGVLFVIIFLIFQGMKLLTAGRNNVVYNLIYGSLVSVVVVVFKLAFCFVHVAYILLLVVGIILVGAFLGICTVRMSIISKDGTVDVGLAQFAKWAFRIIATASIYMIQSTLDVPLALICCSTICCLVTCLSWLADVKRLLHHQLIQKTQKLGDGNRNGNSEQIYLSTFHKTGHEGGLESRSGRISLWNQPSKLLHNILLPQNSLPGWLNTLNKLNSFHLILQIQSLHMEILTHQTDS